MKRRRTAAFERHITSVEIRPVIDPGKRVGVLIQLEHGWTIVEPDQADKIAQALQDAAREARDAS